LAKRKMARCPGGAVLPFWLSAPASPLSLMKSLSKDRLTQQEAFSPATIHAPEFFEANALFFARAAAPACK
jgi:hypothetical protein